MSVKRTAWSSKTPSTKYLTWHIERHAWHIWLHTCAVPSAKTWTSPKLPPRIMKRQDLAWHSPGSLSGWQQNLQILAKACYDLCPYGPKIHHCHCKYQTLNLSQCFQQLDMMDKHWHKQLPSYCVHCSTVSYTRVWWDFLHWDSRKHALIVSKYQVTSNNSQTKHSSLCKSEPLAIAFSRCVSCWGHCRKSGFGQSLLPHLHSLRHPATWKHHHKIKHSYTNSIKIQWLASTSNDVPM